MKNQFLFSLAVLINCFVSAQTIQEADVSLPFHFTFSNPPYPIFYNEPLFIGIDSIATDNIDPILGEANLPPIPPPGFPYRLFLPYDNFSGYLSSFSDFRHGTLPYSGTVEYRIHFWNNVTIHWQLPIGITGLLQDLFGGVIINEPISGIDSFYVPNPGMTALRILLTFDNYTPVELISFNANNENSWVYLEWRTSSEKNNQGFDIERLKDCKTEKSIGWETIGFVEGHGTTTETHSYSFTDEDISTGIHKYRLKQIDLDGTYEYSNEIEVVVDLAPKEFVLYQNYPNPFNPTTKIKFTIPSVETHRDASLLTTLKVYDILGEEVATLVNEYKPAGTYEVEFNSHSHEGQNLTSGIYFYRMAIHSDQLEAGSFIQTKKMILMK